MKNEDYVMSKTRGKVGLPHTREDGHHVPVLRPVVALHDELMCTCDEGQAVVVVERLGNVLAERVSGTTGGDAPAATVVGVGPQEITHGTLVRDLLDPVESPDVVEGVDAGGKTAVEAEDLVVDESGEGEVVEEVGEVLPHVGVAVLAEALVVEAVYLGDLARLVVPAEDGDALGVTNLEGDQKGHGLDGVVASVNVVAWIHRGVG